MIENFEVKGQWFLPNDIENHISGTLFYDINKRFHLELFGSFKEIDVFLNINNVQQFDFILGLTSEGKKITLYKSTIREIKGTIVQNKGFGIPFSILTVNYVFDGVHLSSEDELNFDCLSTEILDFDEWVAISGFDISFLHKNEIKYKLPNPITFNLNDQLEGRFEFSLSNSDYSVYTKKVIFEQRIKFSLNYKREQKYTVLLNDLYKFQSFLMLALYGKTFPYNIILSSNKLIENGEKKQIKLFFHSSFEHKGTNKRKNSEKMLFSYKDIQNDFPIIIKKWYEKYNHLESSFNLLIGQFLNNKRFTENTFLNLAQCVESFHAHTSNKQLKIPKDEYETMKNSILSIVDSKYHTWLKDQFNFGNNVNLHTRLDEIIQFCSCNTIDKIIPDKNSFIKDVKNSRNYYTHYSKNLKKKALKGKDLFYLSQKLKIIIVCSFLLEIGFDKNKLDDFLKEKIRLYVWSKELKIH